MYTLIIIDMQRFFYASRNTRTIKNCKKEIEQAKKDKAAIIFAEYNGYKRTISTLTDLSDGYPKTYIIRKDYDDGSPEIVKLIKAFKLPSKHIRICGVNTDCCVRETMLGINKKLSGCKIELVMNACNTKFKDGKFRTLREIAKLRNIRAV